MILTPVELRTLTGRCHKAGQCAALKAMKIAYVARPDGSPVVLRAAVEHLLAGKSESATSEPDFKFFEVS